MLNMLKLNPNVKYPPMHAYITEGNKIETTQVGAYHPEEIYNTQTFDISRSIELNVQPL